MTWTKNNFKLLIPYGIFILVGIYGVYSVDFIAESQTMDKTFKWCGIPTLILALYYAHRSTFGYPNKVAFWKNILSMFIITISAAMICFVSFQGLLMLINCRLGKQRKYLLTGEVIKLNFPKNKKPMAKYSIEIKREGENDIIKMNVPTTEYSVGQVYKKQMLIGSLGFIYANK